MSKKVKFNKEGHVKPSFRNILCIILKEGKGSSWVWIDENTDKFSLDENTYFKLDVGTYVDGILRFLVYLEGVSTPIHHGYIEREEVERKYLDRDTNVWKKIKMNVIKGLKFDSKVIDMLLNRNIADEFTRQHLDIPNLAIVVMLVISIILNIIGIGTNFI